MANESLQRTSPSSLRLPGSLAMAALIAIAALLALAAPSAKATEWNVHEYSVTPSTTQAGGHPDLEIKFATDSHGEEEQADPCQCNDVKNVDAHLPAGIIGNPHATPTCSDAEFIRKLCPTDSQIGEVEVKVDIGGKWPYGAVIFDFHLALYNMTPKPSQAGLLAWRVPIFELPVYTVLSARTGSDYGLDAKTDGIEHEFSILSASYDLWGVPADPSHDALREGVPNEQSRGYASDSPPIPFLQNPTSCSSSPAPITTVQFSAYNLIEHQLSSPWPVETGCDQLTFNPSLSAQPTTTETDSPSGLEVDLSVPQELSPTTPSPSEIRALTTTLPIGFSINPNAADGKIACQDIEARFGTEAAAQCPDFAKIGTASVDSSALPRPIPGSIYIGAPRPGNRYRIFLTADGFATHIKLAGTVTPDPVTGQLTVSFPELPQSPLVEINLHFFGSERGLLATPTQCGTYPVQSVFTPWDEALAVQEATQLFTLDSGPNGSACSGASRPFNPGFSAASASSKAAARAPFSIELTRADGDQSLSAVTISTPPGFAADLSGIPYCPDAALTAAATLGYAGLAEQATPSCPAASQVGTAIAGAGAGTHPVYLPGKVYLAGPYKGSPLSLAVITPAVSGPYDLGNVVVRVAVKVDPATAQITAVSDPLPHIQEGIPLRLRSIRVSLDRPDFTLNPTNCKASTIAAQISGDQGAQAGLSTHFQVSNCAVLPFAPRFSLRLTGGLNRRGHPAIHALLRTRSGEANSHSVSLTLPAGEIIDNAHIGTPCTQPQFSSGTCPASSLLGSAEAVTPLLDQPLKGNVYLRTNPAHKLPDLVADLRGQIDIELVGHISTAGNGALRTTFANVPDAEVSSFALNLDGGTKGLLQNSRDLCGQTREATLKMTGQNGDQVNTTVPLLASCKRSSRRKATHQQPGGLRP